MIKTQNKYLEEKLVEITINFPDGKERKIKGKMTPEVVNKILRKPEYENTTQIITWDNSID